MILYRNSVCKTPTAVIKEDSERVNTWPISHPTLNLPTQQISTPPPYTRLKQASWNLGVPAKSSHISIQLLHIINKEIEGKKHIPSVQSQ